MQQERESSESGILLSFKRCRVGDGYEPLLAGLSWELRAGECWLVTGPNGGGKSAFAEALAGEVPVLAESGGEEPLNPFLDSAAIVSLEKAAAVIEKEQAEDLSDYVEGGVDPGTLAGDFLLAALAESGAGGKRLEDEEAVRLCGVLPYLDRGLRRLSTGEIRRLLLCRALLVRPALLVLDDPFEGLDASSRGILTEVLGSLAEKTAAGSGPTRLVLVSDRFENLPRAVNRVLELRDRKIAYSGRREDYEALVEERRLGRRDSLDAESPAVLEGLGEAEAAAQALGRAGDAETRKGFLVEMNDVVVQWGEKRVLDRLSWRVRAGEHWLIRGPNGSGKTTLLELITGDNPQVFCNDVRLFGLRRGSGESVWDIKARLGIVSYRLHIQYRAMNGLAVEEVLVSGLRDSIGLYEPAGETELGLARTWMRLCGIETLAGAAFGTLSYGEQRAVLIARAAVKGPALLILDEPCHGLDEEHRDRILGILELVAERGTSTLLHVTHDPTEVLACERRILELRLDAEPMWRILDRAAR